MKFWNIEFSSASSLMSPITAVGIFDLNPIVQKMEYTLLAVVITEIQKYDVEVNCLEQNCRG